MHSRDVQYVRYMLIEVTHVIVIFVNNHFYLFIVRVPLLHRIEAVCNLVEVGATRQNYIIWFRISCRNESFWSNMLWENDKSGIWLWLQHYLTTWTCIRLSIDRQAPLRMHHVWTGMRHFRKRWQNWIPSPDSIATFFLELGAIFLIVVAVGCCVMHSSFRECSGKEICYVANWTLDYLTHLFRVRKWVFLWPCQ